SQWNKNKVIHRGHGELEPREIDHAFRNHQRVSWIWEGLPAIRSATWLSKFLGIVGASNQIFLIIISKITLIIKIAVISLTTLWFRFLGTKLIRLSLLYDLLYIINLL